MYFFHFTEVFLTKWIKRQGGKDAKKAKSTHSDHIVLKLREAFSRVYLQAIKSLPAPAISRLGAEFSRVGVSTFGLVKQRKPSDFLLSQQRAARFLASVGDPWTNCLCLCGYA